jgi:hypothetical protein
LRSSPRHDSLSTFAHEWGHAVHTLLASKNQPFEKAHYSTFIAESASIANEMLLNDHMVLRPRPAMAGFQKWEERFTTSDLRSRSSWRSSSA